MNIIEPHLSPTARKIAEKRYLRTDMKGRIVESPGQMFWRVAHHMAKAEINWDGNGIVKEIAEKFYERMVNWKFVCGGKAMFEAGNPGGTGQLSSCFVLPVQDNIQSIFKTLGNAAVVHKNNGGTGFNFSAIRPRGDKVKNVPHAASGPVDFLAAYSAALSKILQGAKRQGANIGILNVNHPDIEDFIRLKDEDGTIKNFNISVGVTDEFMEAVRDDNMWRLVNPRTKEVVRKVRARTLFRMIADHAWLTGDPGLMFLTRANRDNTTPTLGQIQATNPCITGDALIATEQGLMRFEQLYQKYHNPGRVALVTDHRTITGSGTHLHYSQAFYDQGEQDVFELVTKSGLRLKATPDHKILTPTGWKNLRELMRGDEICIQSHAGQFSSTDVRWNQRLGQLVGYLVGDGFVRTDPNHGGYICITFGRDRIDIADYIKSLLQEYVGSVTTRRPNKRTFQLWKHSERYARWFTEEVGVPSVRSAEKVVPESLLTAPRTAVIGFLQGLFSSDGTVGFVPRKSAYVRLTSKSIRLLQGVQRLLLNLGIASRIYDRSRQRRTKLFPEYVNKKGEKKQYGSDGMLWELEVSKDAVPRFLDHVGFLADLHKEKIALLRGKTYYHAQPLDEVMSVEPAGKERVYDLTEPITHSFIANGIVVSNCGEIPLLPYESCNLTSICLQNHVVEVPRHDASHSRGLHPRVVGSHVRGSGVPADFSDEKSGSVRKSYDIDWDDLEKSVRLGVRFLDDMIEVNTYAIPEIEQMVKYGNRRIGLGVMGFAHLLVKLGIPYNSDEAVRLSDKLSKFIREHAEDESRRLAEVRGNFPNWDVSTYAAKHPMRNCAVTMIAPTGTTAMLADTTSGIEPIFSLVTKRKTFFEGDRKNRPTEELYMVDPVFEEELKEMMGQMDKLTSRQIVKDDKERMKKVVHSSIHPIIHLSTHPSLQEVLHHVAEHGVNSVEGLPDWFYRVFVTAHDIAPEWHVKIQAAWQKYFDNSISKTVNFPHSATVEDVGRVYQLAWKLGCKGITMYRDGSKKDQVLNLVKGIRGIKSTKGTKGQTEDKEISASDTSDTFDTSSAHLHVEAGRPGMGAADICPECGAAIIAENGCVACHSCGWSKCTV